MCKAINTIQRFLSCLFQRILYILISLMYSVTKVLQINLVYLNSLDKK